MTIWANRLNAVNETRVLHVHMLADTSQVITLPRDFRCNLTIIILITAQVNHAY